MDLKKKRFCEDEICFKSYGRGLVSILIPNSSCFFLMFLAPSSQRNSIHCPVLSSVFARKTEFVIKWRLLFIGNVNYYKFYKNEKVIVINMVVIVE